ncbi:MAG: CBS domain-containing protein [Rhodospirillales bacterium]|nr:CBS domain-containing protein [Rhodospirillales bacterium]
MRVSEAMSRDVQVAASDQTLQQAATKMRDLDVGALPVGENDRLVGMITDRDIAIRAVADNKAPSTKVRDAMTRAVKFCYDDEDVDHVARNMGDQQVRRLPVVNRDKRLVGILALGDLAAQGAVRPAAQALEGICQPGGRHSQAPG